MKTFETHESKSHGQVSFPFIIYGGKIPEYKNFYPLHWHEEFEIIYNVKGTGLVIIEGEKYIFKEHDIIIVTPEVIHSISQYKDNSMDYFTILFKLSLLNENDNDLCYEKYLKPILEHKKVIPIYIPAKDELNNKIQIYMKYLTTSCNITIDNNELMIKSCIYALMHLLTKYSISVSSEEINLRAVHDKLKKILSYVENNYSDEISIKHAASLTGFSESHFMKLFKEFTGKSFTQYLKDYRLEIAASLLLNSSQKIIDISENTGFNNYSYFIRSFTKKYKVTPSKFRINSSK